MGNLKPCPSKDWRVRPMNGYQYRCQVNGNIYSNIYSLQFNTSWEGNTNSSWNNPANWSCGSLPDANTDVIISGGKPNYPQVNSDFTIRSLKLNSGATVNVNTGFKLTILKKSFPGPG